MATDKLDIALKNAIKTTSDFCEVRGIKRLTTEGIWLYDENDKEKTYMVVVNHKAVQISEWSVSFEEETCNFSVFEVHVYKGSGKMEALYDGSGWTDRETLVCDFVSWGDFTNEVAKMWLSQIYLGTEPEEARDECLKAMGVKTEEDGEQETAEVPSETPSEPTEVARMNSYFRRELAFAPAIVSEILNFASGHNVKMRECKDEITFIRDDNEVFTFSAEIRIEDLTGKGVMKAYSHLHFYNSVTGAEPYILPTEVA